VSAGIAHNENLQLGRKKTPDVTATENPFHRPWPRRDHHKENNLMSHRSRPQILNLAILTLSCIGLASIVLAQVGPPGGMIYAHDEVYRVVATPRDLPNQGPFDTIYVLGAELASVSDAAPGDPDYNGGRWEVRMVDFTAMPPMQFTNAEEVLDAAAQGDIVIGDVVRRFECPLIKGHPGHGHR
jgi:hypothetical protein